MVEAAIDCMKSPEEKLAAKKAKMKRNTEDLNNILKEWLNEKGYTFFIDSPTNQIFVTVTNEKKKELEDKVVFSFWGNIDEDHTAIRFVTSWATKMEDVEELIRIL